MKKLILFFTILFNMFAINTYSNNINGIDTDFSKIVVQTPCKILYGINQDTTTIINKTPIYNVYWELKDSTLYIKQKRYFYENNYNDSNMPVILILFKDKNKLPLITTSSSLMICENNKNINTKLNDTADYKFNN